MHDNAIVGFDQELFKISRVTLTFKTVLVKACKTAKLGDSVFPGLDFYKSVKEPKI